MLMSHGYFKNENGYSNVGARLLRANEAMRAGAGARLAPGANDSPLLALVVLVACVFAFVVAVVRRRAQHQQPKAANTKFSKAGEEVAVARSEGGGLAAGAAQRHSQ
jgi:hypothetical protein